MQNCEMVYGPKKLLKEVFDRIDFGLFSASAVYLDLLSNGIKAYQVITEAAYPIVENELDKIHSTEDFISKYEAWQSLSESECTTYMNNIAGEFLSDINAETTYKKVVDDIIQ